MGSALEEEDLREGTTVILATEQATRLAVESLEGKNLVAKLWTSAARKRFHCAGRALSGSRRADGWEGREPPLWDAADPHGVRAPDSPSWEHGKEECDHDTPARNRGHYLKEPIRLMAGMTIRNSETGYAARDFRKMVWNLICWNGAITESVLRNYHVGRELDSDETGNIWTEETLRAEVELLRLKTRDIIRDAMDPRSMDDFVDKAKASMENQITVPMDELIVNVTRRWGFTKPEGQKLLENVLEGGPGNKTQWGLSQGINALAYFIESTDRQYEMERLSSDVVALGPKDWKAIAN